MAEGHSLFDWNISTFDVKLVWLLSIHFPIIPLGFVNTFRQATKVGAVLPTLLLTPMGRSGEESPEQLSKMDLSWMWCHKLEIPELSVLRQGDCQLKVCLGYIASSRTIRARTWGSPTYTYTQLDVMENSCRTWKVEARRNRSSRPTIDSYIVSLRTACVTQELVLKQKQNRTNKMSTKIKQKKAHP